VICCSGNNFRDIRINSNRLWIKFTAAHREDDSREWGYSFDIRAVCSEKSRNFLDKTVADANRQAIVLHENFADKLKIIKNLSGSVYANARLFVCLAISNLTMCEDVSEDAAALTTDGHHRMSSTRQVASKTLDGDAGIGGNVKAALMRKLTISFFLPPPDCETAVERTCMLCLSELFESESNRAYLSWPEKDALLAALNKAGRSEDIVTVQLAVKALCYLAQCQFEQDEVLKDLLKNNVMETLYDASKRIRNLTYLKFAYVGMLVLSQNVDALLEHAVLGCQQGQIEGDLDDAVSARVASWILFVKTLPVNDSFFSRPLCIESKHPVDEGFEATFYRPGSSAIVVSCQDVYFSKDLAKREELVLYNSYKKDSTKVDTIISTSTTGAEPLQIFSDSMMAEIRHSNSAGPPGWGCRLKVTPVFGKNVFLLPEKNSTRKVVEMSVEASDHPLVFETTPKTLVELAGVTAYRIVFHKESHIRVSDKLVFYIEDPSNADGEYLKICELTGKVSAPGTWPSESRPLIIPASKFWYEFIPDEDLDEDDEWGYEFACCKGVTHVESFENEPGNIVFSFDKTSWNEVLHFEPGGEYHTGVAFNELDTLCMPKNGVIEFFLEEIADSVEAAEKLYCVVGLPKEMMQGDIPNCEGCDSPMVYSADVCHLGFYYDDYGCDQCGVVKAGGRWCCCNPDCEQRTDYCFNCRPKQHYYGAIVYHDLPHEFVIPQSEFYCRMRILADDANPGSVAPIAMAAFRSYDALLHVMSTSPIQIDSYNTDSYELTEDEDGNEELIFKIDTTAMNVFDEEEGSYTIGVAFLEGSSTDNAGEYIQFWSNNPTDPEFPGSVDGAPKCRKGHGLVMSSRCDDVYRYYQCDDCSAAYSDHRLTCRECYYDLCNDCAFIMPTSEKIHGKLFELYTPDSPLIVTQHNSPVFFVRMIREYYDSNASFRCVVFDPRKVQFDPDRIKKKKSVGDVKIASALGYAESENKAAFIQNLKKLCWSTDLTTVQLASSLLCNLSNPSAGSKQNTEVVQSVLIEDTYPLINRMFNSGNSWLVSIGIKICNNMFNASKLDPKDFDEEFAWDCFKIAIKSLKVWCKLDEISRSIAEADAISVLQNFEASVGTILSSAGQSDDESESDNKKITSKASPQSRMISGIIKFLSMVKPYLGFESDEIEKTLIETENTRESSDGEDEISGKESEVEGSQHIKQSREEEERSGGSNKVILPITAEDILIMLDCLSTAIDDPFDDEVAGEMKINNLLRELLSLLSVRNAYIRRSLLGLIQKVARNADIVVSMLSASEDTRYGTYLFNLLGSKDPTILEPCCAIINLFYSWNTISAAGLKEQKVLQMQRQKHIALSQIIKKYEGLEKTSTVADVVKEVAVPTTNEDPKREGKKEKKKVINEKYSQELTQALGYSELFVPTASWDAEGDSTWTVQHLLSSKSLTHNPDMSKRVPIGGFCGHRIFDHLNVSFGVSFWVFCSSIEKTAVVGQDVISQMFFLGSSGAGQKFAITVNEELKLRFAVPVVSADSHKEVLIVSSRPLQLNSWNHVFASAWMTDSTNCKSEIYLNGQCVATGTVAKQIGKLQQSSTDWFVGRVPPEFSRKQQAFLHGAFENVKLYSPGLQTAEADFGKALEADLKQPPAQQKVCLPLINMAKDFIGATSPVTSLFLHDLSRVDAYVNLVCQASRFSSFSEIIHDPANGQLVTNILDIIGGQDFMINVFNSAVSFVDSSTLTEGSVKPLTVAKAHIYNGMSIYFDEASSLGYNEVVTVKGGVNFEHSFNYYNYRDPPIFIPNVYSVDVSCTGRTQWKLAAKPVWDSSHSHDDKAVTVGTAHPYDDRLETVKNISIPGAKQLEIVFHPDCSTEYEVDMLRFYKDETFTEIVGPQLSYSGPKGINSHFPSKPFVIDGDSFCARFVTDGSGNDWGYEFTVRIPYSEEKDYILAIFSNFAGVVENLASMHPEALFSELCFDGLRGFKKLIKILNSVRYPLVTEKLYYALFTMLRNRVCSDDSSRPSTVIYMLESLAASKDDFDDIYMVKWLLQTMCLLCSCRALAEQSVYEVESLHPCPDSFCMSELVSIPLAEKLSFRISDQSDISGGILQLLTASEESKTFDHMDATASDALEFETTQVLISFLTDVQNPGWGFRCKVNAKYPASLPFDEDEAISKNWLDSVQIIQFLQLMADPYFHDSESISSIGQSGRIISRFIELSQNRYDIGAMSAEAVKALSNMLFVADGTSAPTKKLICDHFSRLRHSFSALEEDFADIFQDYEWNNNLIMNRLGVPQACIPNKYLSFTGGSTLVVKGDVYWEVSVTRALQEPSFSVGCILNPNIGKADCKHGHSLVLVPCSQCIRIGSCTACAVQILEAEKYCYNCPQCHGGESFYCRKCTLGGQGSGHAGEGQRKEHGDLRDISGSFGITVRYLDGHCKLSYFVNSIVSDDVDLTADEQIGPNSVIGIHLAKDVKTGFSYVLKFVWPTKYGDNYIVEVPLEGFMANQLLYPAASIYSPGTELGWNFSSLHVSSYKSTFTSTGCKFAGSLFMSSTDDSEDMYWHLYDNDIQRWRRNTDYDQVMFPLRTNQNRLVSTRQCVLREIARGLYGYYSTLPNKQFSPAYYDDIRSLCGSADKETQSWAARTALILFQSRDFADNAVGITPDQSGDTQQSNAIVTAIIDNLTTGKISYSDIMTGLFAGAHLFGFQLVSNSLNGISHFPGRRGQMYYSAMNYPSACEDTFEVWLEGSQGLEIMFDPVSASRAEDVTLKVYWKDPAKTTNPDAYLLQRIVGSESKFFPSEEHPCYIPKFDRVWLVFSAAERYDPATSFQWTIAALFVNVDRQQTLEEIMTLRNVKTSKVYDDKMAHDKYGVRHFVCSAADSKDTVEFPGAEGICVAFCSSSVSTADLHLVFFDPDSEHTEHGQFYGGINCDHNFAGVDGVSPLVVNSTKIAFKCNGTGTILVFTRNCCLLPQLNCRFYQRLEIRICGVSACIRVSNCEEG
jgi:hypothetical protein